MQKLYEFSGSSVVFIQCNGLGETDFSPFMMTFHILHFLPVQTQKLAQFFLLAHRVMHHFISDAHKGNESSESGRSKGDISSRWTAQTLQNDSKNYSVVKVRLMKQVQKEKVLTRILK
jgi:hypothetical protein